jgi:hypothetical protein
MFENKLRAATAFSDVKFHAQLDSDPSVRLPRLSFFFFFPSRIVLLLSFGKQLLSSAFAIIYQVAGDFQPSADTSWRSCNV